MKRQLAFILVMFFAINTLFAKNIEIIEKPEGLRVKLNQTDIGTSSYLTHDQTELLTINNADHVDPFVNFSGYAIPVIKFIAAVPHNANLNTKIDEFNIKSLGKKNLPLYSNLLQDSIRKRFINGSDIQITKEIIEPSVSYEYLGEQRGVPEYLITIQPFRYDPLSGDLAVLDQSTVDIDFGKEAAMSDAAFSNGERALFSGVVNKKHLRYLVSNSKVKINKGETTPEILSAPDWYDPNRKYLKVMTTTDGAARIDVTDILKHAPEWNNKKTSNLHLIYKGEEYPCYISDDNNTIDGNEKIYFLGRRAAGDSTWFDHYTENEPFYLYYDQNSGGIRLSSHVDPVNTVEKVSSVKINQRIEYDKIYYIGKYLLKTENIFPEGWYQTIIDQSFDKEFQQPVFVFPSDDPSESIDVSTAATTLLDSIFIDGTWHIPSYELRFLVNYDTADIQRFDLIREKKFTGKFTKNSILPGLNYVGLRLMATDTFKTKKAGIDYYAVEGNSKPVAYKGNIIFDPGYLDENSSIEVTGFKSPDIAAIDSLNKTIKFLQASNGTTVHMGGIAGDKPTATVVINDSGMISKKRGFHIMYLPVESPGTPKVQTYENPGDVSSLIDALPDNTFISGVYNGENSIGHQGLLNKLKAAGLNRASSHSAGDVYAFYFRKGTSVSGDQLNSGMTAISKFVQDNAGISYKAELKIKEQTSYKFFMNDSKTVEEAVIKKTNSSNLTDTNNAADGLIISHENLLNQAQRLAKHRKDFQDIDIEVVNVDDIYKEFNYGKKSPHAIRNFLRYTLDNWKQAPTHAIMFGDASWDPKLNWKNSQYEDLVPTFGLPTSDTWYGLSNDKQVNNFIVGRIPARNSDTAENFVDKLIQYDTSKISPWHKKFFFISGGYGPAEIRGFCKDKELFIPYIEGPEICGITESVCKSEEANIGQKDAGRVRKIINDGVVWANFLGHGSAEYFDLDGWQVQTLNNYGKYFIFSTLSCNSGEFANPKVYSRNESYLMAPEKGAIASMGATAVSSALIEKKIMYYMLQGMEQDAKRELGEIFFAGKASLSTKNDLELRALEHYLYLGDPYTRIKIDTVPDLYFLKGDFQLASEEGSSIITTENDSVTISGSIYNAGTSLPEPYIVRVIRIYNGKTDIYDFEINGTCYNENFSFKIPVKDMPGQHVIDVIIDPEKETNEIHRENNAVSATIDVFAPGVSVLDPMAFWDVNSSEPIFRVLNLFAEEGEFEYEMHLKTSSVDSANALISANTDDLDIDESFIQWKPDIELENGTSYWFFARLRNMNEQEFSTWLKVPFYASETGGSEIVHWSQNTAEELSSNKHNFNLTNENHGKYKIPDKQVDYYCLSSKGTPPSKRWANIEINSDVYVNTEYARGFSVVTISKNTGEGKIHGFDTWKDDSSSIKLVNFIRDSINNNHYVFIATCDRSFEVPISKRTPPSIGSIDTLKKVFREEFSTTLFDSVKKSSSYAMFSFKDAVPDEVVEAHDPEGRDAVIDGKVPIYDTAASVQTIRIGPAKEWKNFSIDGSTAPNLTELKGIVQGYNVSGSQKDLLLEFDEFGKVDLSRISAGNYPYIDIDITLNRGENIKEEPYISEIRSEFIPQPELAIPRSSIKISQTPVLRGLETEIGFAIRNISLRTTADQVKVNTEVSSEDVVIDQFDFSKSHLLPDERVEEKFIVNTKSYNPENDVNFQLSPDGTDMDIYKFNNSAKSILNVREDQEQPQIVVISGSQELYEGIYLPKNPLFEINIYDNSPLEIPNDNIRVKINGYYQNQDNTKEYNFIKEPDPQNPSYKLLLRLRPDSLDQTSEFTEHWIQVTAEDATGNKDTVLYRFNINRNYEITEYKNYPNPFEQNTTFNLTYKAPENAGTAVIRIYNPVGQHIRTLEKDLSLGENEIYWDGFDKKGRKVPVGAYYYRINVENVLYVEPVTGSLMINR